MRQADVTVIDYGVGNLLSVRHSLEHCGATVEVTSDRERILTSPRVILPGVGAFGDAMAELGRRGLDIVVREVVQRGHALLGICLGMQMLMEESDEFGIAAGLGLIPGRVVAVPQATVDGAPQKIPHIGWNELLPAGNGSWDGTVLQSIRPGDSVYFVHSFMAAPPLEYRIADCIYGGHRIAAVVGRDRVTGCQFHPEKSGDVGLRILKQFLMQ
jgi:glutamine amidotransferase